MVGVVTVLVIYLVGMHLQMNQSLKQKLTPDIDYILILGSSLRSNHVTQTLRSRLEKGAELLKEHPQLMVVVTGGKGSETLPPEAHLMQKVLIEEYGIEKSEVERVRKRFDKRRAGYYYANTARKRNERIISKTISGAIYFPTAPFCAMDKIFICIFSQSEDW